MANSDKIKYIPEASKTGAFSVDISLYNEDYILAGVILSYKSGSPTTMKIGLSPGGDDVMFETDISYMTNRRMIGLNSCFKTSEDTLYCDINSGTYDIDFVFIQRIGAS